MKDLRKVATYMNSLKQPQKTYQCSLVTAFCSPLQNCLEGKVMKKGFLAAFLFKAIGFFVLGLLVFFGVE